MITTALQFVNFLIPGIMFLKYMLLTVIKLGISWHITMCLIDGTQN